MAASREAGQRGREEAFARLRPVAEVSARLTHQQFRAVLRPEYGSDDASQEGLLKLWRLLGEYPDASDALVRVSVARAVRDAGRARKAARGKVNLPVRDHEPLKPTEPAVYSWFKDVLPTAPARVRTYIEKHVIRGEPATHKRPGYVVEWLRSHDWVEQKG